MEKFKQSVIQYCTYLDNNPTPLYPLTIGVGVLCFYLSFGLLGQATGIGAAAISVPLIAILISLMAK